MDSRSENKVTPNEEKTHEVVAQLQEMQEIFSDPVSFEPLVEAVILTCGHSFNAGTLEFLNKCAICRDEDLEDPVVDYMARKASGLFSRMNLKTVQVALSQYQQLAEENKKLKVELVEYKKLYESVLEQSSEEKNSLLNGMEKLLKDNRFLQENIARLDKVNQDLSNFLKNVCQSLKENNQMINRVLQTNTTIFLQPAAREVAISIPAQSEGATHALAQPPMLFGPSMHNVNARKSVAQRERWCGLFPWSISDRNNSNFVQDRHDTPHSSALHPPSASQ